MCRQPDARSLRNSPTTTWSGHGTGACRVLGGTQSLHTNSLDETLALPSQKAVTIALGPQQILAEESGVSNTVDSLCRLRGDIILARGSGFGPQGPDRDLPALDELAAARVGPDAHPRRARPTARIRRHGADAHGSDAGLRHPDGALPPGGVGGGADRRRLPLRRQHVRREPRPAGLPRREGRPDLPAGLAPRQRKPHERPLLSLLRRQVGDPRHAGHGQVVAHLLPDHRPRHRRSPASTPTTSAAT